MRQLLRWGITASVLALTTAAASATDMSLPAHFTAWALNAGRGRTGSVDLTVSRWSGAADVERMTSAFDEQGMPGLIRALDHLPRVGSIRSNGALGYDVQFTERSAGPDGGQRIFIMAERRLGFGEVANMARSADYPLTIVELQLNDDGEGTGTMWPAARITYWDPQTFTVVIDNYMTQPIRLTGVRLQRNHRT